MSAAWPAHPFPEWAGALLAQWASLREVTR